MSRTARRLVCWITVVLGVALLWPESALAGKKVLRVWLKGPVMEAPAPGFDLAALLGGQEAKTLYQWLKTIDRAAEDDEIAGIFLLIEQPQMSLAQVEEFSRALQAFRARGKKIYCYVDHAGNLSYALACSADHITLAEHSEVAITGISGAMMFFKGLFDKIGVQADMLHCGAYKSAVEPFTRTEPSREAAENVNWLLDGLFARWLGLIAEGRGLSVDQMRTLVDAAPLPAEEALRRKLVDEVSSFPAFKQRLHDEFGSDVEVLKKLKRDDEFKIDFNNPFAIFELFGKLLEETSEPPQPGIAVLYIEGVIGMGKNEPSIFGGTSAGANTIRAAFGQAREDDNIKAVVVRVNSPGGSALASDIMWEAATRCAAEKPLIVSMGGVAGSGGYYVSIPGEVIFAEETTLTGSIGVLGGKLVWRELMEDKLGITTTEFHRGRRAGIWSMNRTWTDEERAWMQEYIDAIYAQFKGRVMESRGDRIKGELDDIAGGRVYTGRQALEHGLVDRLGGLNDAIDFAARKVGLDDEYEIYVLPEPLDIAEVILKRLMGEDLEDEFEISTRMAQPTDPLLHAVLPLVRQLAPQQAREIVQYLQNALIINREHVGCFMPFISQPR